jgi:hypothetical protein
MSKTISEPVNEKVVKTPTNILDGILPFTEKPANENAEKAYDREGKLAYELFFCFTADTSKKK